MNSEAAVVELGAETGRMLSSDSIVMMREQDWWLRFAVLPSLLSAATRECDPMYYSWQSCWLHGCPPSEIETDPPGAVDSGQVDRTCLHSESKSADEPNAVNNMSPLSIRRESTYFRQH